MVDRGYLGIALAPMQISRQATDEGVLILGIAEDSPASESGIRATSRDDEGEILWGDVVVSLQGERVADSESLLVKLQEYHAGDEVTLGLKRGDEFVRLPIRLGSRPKQDM